MFARPCPSRPRHGFVESRKIKSLGDAIDLMGEVRDEDPDGEIILMPYLTGEYSGVVTNAGITWGPGHDGATGLENTVMVPTPLSVELWNESVIGYVLKSKELGILDCAYLELVEDGGSTVAVQVRDGPAQETKTGDFVPKTFTLRKVITPSNAGRETSKVETPNLIKWERLIRQAKKDKGVAILIPTDPNRASHFAVHGILAGMPVIFSKDVNWFKENEGKEISATEGEEVKTGKLYAKDYRALADRIMLRIAYPEKVTQAELMNNRTRCRDRVVTSIGVCHAMASWGPEPHLLSLRAEGVVNCLFYTIKACFGEVRHFHRSGPGRADLELPGLRPMKTDLGDFINADDMYKLKYGEREIGRDTVYANVTGLCLYDQLRILQRVVKDLHNPGWSQQFGGESWADAAWTARILGYTLIRFCEKPDAAGWAKCAMLYNRVINACHNSGKVLTKWCSSDVFEVGNRAPVMCLMNPVAATRPSPGPARC